MIRKATTSILEGIKNKMLKIDGSTKESETEDDFIGLGDDFEYISKKDNNLTSAEEVEDNPVNKEKEISDEEYDYEPEPEEEEIGEGDGDFDDLTENSSEKAEADFDLGDYEVGNKVNEPKEGADTDIDDDIDEDLSNTEYDDLDENLLNLEEEESTSNNKEIDFKEDALEDQVEVDGLSDLDHEIESDFEMEDKKVTEKSELRVNTSALQDFKDNDISEEYAALATKEVVANSDIESSFNADDFNQDDEDKNDFFFNEDSSNNKIASTAIPKKEFDKSIKSSGIEDSFSIINIENTGDNQIDLSFEDMASKVSYARGHTNPAKSTNINMTTASMLSQDTIKRSSDVIREIMGNMNHFGDTEPTKFAQGISVEEMVAIMLQPKLEEWLNDHLPDLVERVVREEVRKILPNKS